MATDLGNHVRNRRFGHLAAAVPQDHIVHVGLRAAGVVVDGAPRGLVEEKRIAFVHGLSREGDPPWSSGFVGVRRALDARYACAIDEQAEAPDAGRVLMLQGRDRSADGGLVPAVGEMTRRCGDPGEVTLEAGNLSLIQAHGFEQ